MHNKISTSIYYLVGQDLRVLLNTQKKPLSHESIQLQGAFFYPAFELSILNISLMLINIKNNIIAKSKLDK